MQTYPAPVANGISTDHPVPGLPFVDDSHIPLDDPQAIEAIGRHDGTGTWGRCDTITTRAGDETGWAAFTTDALRPDLAWVVRWHPEHGRSVLVYPDKDSASVYSDFTIIETLLLTRAGGYWWDGTSWFRPLQVWDRARERFVHRAVPAARAITAADLLKEGADPDRARVLNIKRLDLDRTGPERWSDDLAMWARYRARHRPDAGSLNAAVLNVTAPELTGEELVGVIEMAEIAQVAASTLRAYISRGEGDVPQPQATVGGRSVWARPVAEEWAERRRHSSESATSAVSTSRLNGTSKVPAGMADDTDTFTQLFFNQLWGNPARRKQWSLRWRTEGNVRDLAKDLGWTAASNLTTLVPISALADTVTHAVLGDFATSQQRYRDDETDNDVMYFVMPQVATTFDWLIRHHPRAALRALNEIIGEAERKLQMKRPVIVKALRGALIRDGKLRGDDLEEFLAAAISPTT